MSEREKIGIKTVGIIIIGDEILKGQIADLNMHYLCQQLYAVGAKVLKVSIIGDGLDSISNEVREFAKMCDVVLTTGGVGPTHDDMTYEGVAKAFNEPIFNHPELEQVYNKLLGTATSSREGLAKMWAVPTSALLIFAPEAHLTSFPIVNVRNVYILPGVPKYLQEAFPRLYPMFRDKGICRKIHTRMVYVAQVELSIVSKLNEAVDKFKHSVQFGSYPVLDNLYYSTRLVLESASPAALQEAYSFLVDLLPSESIIESDSEPLKSAMDRAHCIVRDDKHPCSGERP